MPEKITDGKVNKGYAVDDGCHVRKSREFYLHLVQEEEKNNYLENVEDASNDEVTSNIVTPTNTKTPGNEDVNKAEINDSGVKDPETVKNPHDKLFKNLFSSPEFFKDFLKVSIGEDFADNLVAGSYAEAKTDFIGRDLQEYYSDIIYTARVGKTEYQFAFLIEHKSYPDKQVTFQILNYLQKMLEKSWSQKKFIQPVLAFLVYHGEGSSRLIDFNAEYSHLPEEIRRDLFGVKIREVNITELDPNAISNNLLYISYLLVSINRAEDKRHHIEFILKQMGNSKDRKLSEFASDKLGIVLYYLFNMTELPYQELKEIFDKYFSKEEDEMKTTADQLREEGREEIREQVREELIESIKLMYEMKFNNKISEELIKVIENLSVEKLQKAKNMIPEMDSPDKFEEFIRD